MRKQETNEHGTVPGCVAAAHPPSGLRQKRWGTGWLLRPKRVFGGHMGKQK